MLIQSVLLVESFLVVLCVMVVLSILSESVVVFVNHLLSTVDNTFNVKVGNAGSMSDLYDQIYQFVLNKSLVVRCREIF